MGRNGGRYKASWDKNKISASGRTRNGRKFSGTARRSNVRKTRRDIRNGNPCAKDEEEVWIYDEDEDYEDSDDEDEDSEDEDSEDDEDEEEEERNGRNFAVE